VYDLRGESDNKGDLCNCRAGRRAIPSAVCSCIRLSPPMFSSPYLQRHCRPNTSFPVFTTRRGTPTTPPVFAYLIIFPPVISKTRVIMIYIYAFDLHHTRLNYWTKHIICSCSHDNNNIMCRIESAAAAAAAVVVDNNNYKTRPRRTVYTNVGSGPISDT